MSRRFDTYPTDEQMAAAQRDLAEERLLAGARFDISYLYACGMGRLQVMVEDLDATTEQQAQQIAQIRALIEAVTRYQW